METKALGLALLAALISLGGTLLAAPPIKWLMNSSGSQTETTSLNSSLEPTASPELVEQGRQSFTMSCAECHGNDAHGDEGPDLHNIPLSNARIATTIKKGIKGEMPGFAKKYNDDQVAALLAYLQSLH